MTKKGKGKFFLMAVGGAFIGFINGFFGGGGGMLCVPLLNKGLKEKTKTAHASTILVILPITIVSAIMYSLKGHFVMMPSLITMAGVVTGGILGAKLLKKLPAKAIGFVFATLMLAAGIKLVI